MSPQAFNAQLAEHKLESIRILLIQAKTGSHADRVRAAAAIVRIPWAPIPSDPAKRARRAHDNAAPSPPLPLPAGEGRNEGVSTEHPQTSVKPPPDPNPDSDPDVHPSRDPETVARFAPGLIANAPHPMPPQTPRSFGAPIIILQPPMNSS